VIEGSSHDFLTDAFRAMGNAQIGAIRGFRYGTHVPVGPIKLEDLYHYIPIGPQIAVGTIKGQAMKNQIENAADGSLNPDPRAWTGGWLFNFSGVTMDLDAYQPNGSRASNIMVNGSPLNVAGTYTYASYWYAGDPTLINRVPATNIQVLKDEQGNVMDATEVVARYLQTLQNQTADPVLHRINLLRPLPLPLYGNGEVQPLMGVSP
jgi:sulfur-oxidizing protein SoxB